MPKSKHDYGAARIQCQAIAAASIVQKLCHRPERAKADRCVVINSERWNALSKAFEQFAETAYAKLGCVINEHFERMLQTAKTRTVTSAH